jgi:hypothetical protein
MGDAVRPVSRSDRRSGANWRGNRADLDQSPHLTAQWVPPTGNSVSYEIEIDSRVNPI